MKKDRTVTDYLDAVILTANEVVDFRGHCVHLFDEESQKFEGLWHFIEGYERHELPSNARSFEKFLRSLLIDDQAMTVGVRPEVKEGFRLDPGSAMIPLYLGDRAVGLLALWPAEGRYLTSYDAYLVGCVAKIVATGFDGGGARDLLAPLRFSMLHRRRFLSATPGLSEVIGACLERALGSGGYSLLSREVKVCANCRIAYREDTQAHGFSLRFFDCLGAVSRASESRAQKHEVIVTAAEKKAWLDLWAKSDGRAPPDIDAKYGDIFRQIRSHVAVPCHYGDSLYGILSVDSPRSHAFDNLTVRSLCILGAQAAPLIANAIARTKLEKERRYFKDILDAIPDEVLVIDKNAHIVLMNRAKKEHFPDAGVGEFCYEAFEYGRKSRCRQCYTLGTIESGRPVTQALWQYKDPNTLDTTYVELSAGEIKTAKEEVAQAVEVARNVKDREAMLKWMEDVQYDLRGDLSSLSRELVHDPDALADWLWERAARGLKLMGIPRGRIYTYRRGLFFGKMVFPKTAFTGKDFTKFFLDPRTDIPSKITLRDRKLRPVRFVIDDSLKQEWHMRKLETAWNYLTCYLKRVPPKCAKYLGKGGILSWIDVPIGVTGQVYGKISADKGVPSHSRDIEPETAYEMSLLASFGRFTSVTMYVAEQYALLAGMERKEAALEFATLSLS